jgi:hypothetical protein
MTASFRRDHAALNPEQKAAFRRAVSHFIEDLPSRAFRKGLRVKGVKGARGIYEMTWAGNGRATFQFGPPEIQDEVHVIWRRIGTHGILDQP